MRLIPPFLALQSAVPASSRNGNAAPAASSPTVHPARLIVLISLWLATACNLPL